VGSCHLKVVVAIHLGLDVVGERALELDDLPTTQADEMVMFRSPPLDLIMMMFLIEMQLFDEIQLLEKAQGTIDGGQADTWLPFLGQKVEFIGVQVPPMLLHNLEKEQPLGGDPLPLGTK
jgi:hypothetical protein